VVHEIGREIGLGGRDRMEAAQAELGDEAVLQRFQRRSMRPLACGECAAI
jgi:hypothetical protein